MFEVPPRRQIAALRAVFFLVAAVLLTPYVITPFYTYGEPVSTLMLWRRLTGQPVERIYVPLSKVSPALPWRCSPPRMPGSAALRRRFHRTRQRHCRCRRSRGHARRLHHHPAGREEPVPVAGPQLVRKALEFPLALWIDLVLSKRRILEIYLNVAEWGPNGVFGAEAGSRRAFGKPAQHLTGYEAALLAASLPNPD